MQTVPAVGGSWAPDISGRHDAERDGERAGGRGASCALAAAELVLGGAPAPAAMQKVCLQAAIAQAAMCKDAVCSIGPRT